jgi:4'-phosphopantetheinyl transferase
MKNVDIFFSFLPHDFNENLYLSKLPVFLQEKITKIRDSKTKKMAIFNKIVLQQILNNNLENLKYSEFGRPYLENHPNFNISHSENYLVCAIAKDAQIGIDVEELKEINFQGLSKRYFHKNEQQLIENKRDFFEIWTRKEAILKAHGCGLRIELKQLDTTKNPIELDQKYWLYLIDLPIENSVCHLATSFPNATLSLQAFEFPCGY